MRTLGLLFVAVILLLTSVGLAQKAETGEPAGSYKVLKTNIT